jgi:hypothetical protein
MTAPFIPQEIAAEGLKPEEYQDIVQRLGRHPNKEKALEKRVFVKKNQGIIFPSHRDKI